MADDGIGQYFINQVVNNLANNLPQSPTNSPSDANEADIGAAGAALTTFIEAAGGGEFSPALNLLTATAQTMEAAGTDDDPSADYVEDAAASLISLAAGLALAPEAGAILAGVGAYGAGVVYGSIAEAAFQTFNQYWSDPNLFEPNSPLGPYSPTDPNGFFGPNGPLAQNDPFGPNGPFGPGKLFGPDGGLPPWLLGHPAPPDPRDPLILNFGSGDVTVTPLTGSSTFFDFSGSGIANATGWLAENEGFLIQLPPNGGTITANNLLGSQSGDGFSDLAAFDTNHDGTIDANDAGYSELGVWIDANANGIADAGEIYTLSQLGVVSISLDTTPSSTPSNGGTTVETATFTIVNPNNGNVTQHQIAEVDLNTSTILTSDQSPGGVTLNSATFTLPDLRGYGNVADLDVAMSSNANLLEDVTALVQNISSMDFSQFDATFKNILYEWAGSSDIDPSSYGPDIDARQLLVDYAFYGLNPETSPVYQIDPNWHSGPMWQSIFNSILATYEARFIAQVTFDAFENGATTSTLDSSFWTNFAPSSYDPNTDSITLNIPDVVNNILNHAPSDPTSMANYFAEAAQVFSVFAPDLFGSDPQELNSLALANAYSSGASAAQLASLSAALGETVVSLQALGGDVATTAQDAIIVETSGISSISGGVDDTYVWDATSGSLTISDTGAVPIIFIDGISLDQTSFSRSGMDGLAITNNVTGAQIIISNAFTNDGQEQGSLQAVAFNDGAVLSWRAAVDRALIGSPQNAGFLSGTVGADTFDPAGYSHSVFGDGGADTFIYNAGYGNLEINEDAGFEQTSQAVLELGPGITAADISVQGQARMGSQGGGALILTDGVTGDQITIDEMANNGFGGVAEYGVEAVEFADGTVLTRQQLIDMSLQASLTNTQLFGTYDAEVLDSKGYATFEEGNGGADTFIYDRGYGALELEEDINRGDGDAGIIQFGPGITAADLTVTGDAGGDLFITDGTSGDQLKLDAWNGEISPGFGELEFADGTTLDSQQLVNMSLIGSAGNTALYGTFNADTFDSRGIATYEQGNGGADTFIYDAGYGRLRIDEDSGSQPADAVLQLGPGLTASDLHVAMGPGDSLVLTDGVAGDAITLDQMANVPSGQPEYGIGEVQFADGSTLTAQQLLAMNTGAVYGQATASLIDSAGVASLAEGYSGADTFVYNSGYGPLEINENSGWNSNNSVLAFGSGISASQLAVYEDNSGDIILDDGVTGDQITLDGMAYNSSSGVAEVTFADGSSLSANDLFNMAMPYIPPGEVIDGGGADTYEQGGGGPDTFVYNAGYGHLEINEVAQGDSSEAVLQLGPGITQQDLTVLVDTSGDYILLDGDAGDSIQLDGMASSSQDGISEVEFADGTTLSASDLSNMSLAEGPPGTIYGSPQADLIDTKGQAPYISDDGGGDTFIYNTGYGPLTINEYQAASPAANILQLGAGISPSDVSVRVQEDSYWGNDIVLTLNGSNDAVTLLGMAGSVASGVQAVEFSDGTVWSNVEILSKVEAGVLTIEPSAAPMSFDNASLGGSPVIALNIDDASGNWSVAAGGASFTDLVLTASQGSSVTLVNALTEDAVPTVNFWADHVSWNYQTLLGDLENPTNSSAGIFGDASANTLDTKGQVSFAHGGGGDDSYVYNAGYGPLTIDNTSTVDAGAHGEVDFGAGETPDNLWFDQNGNDLQIDVLGTNDQIIIQGWYGQNPSAQVATLHSGDGQALAAAGVEQLVQAMATFEASYMASNGTAFVPSQSQSTITDPTVMAAVSSAWHH